MPENKINPVVEGSIARTVVSLALPVVAGMFMEFALSITDFFWVGKLGTQAQDAVTSSMVIIWSVFSSISIISVGITALISRYIGAQRPDKAAFFVKQGMMLALFLGSLVAVVGFTFSSDFLEFMEAGPDTLAMAVPYIRIFFASSILFFAAETGYAAFRASGDTRTPTKIAVMVVVMNLVLDPMLIFGFGPIPAMGVSGASLATGISILFGAIIVLSKIARGRLGYEVRLLHNCRPQLHEMYRIARIGLPMSIQQFVFSGVYWFLIKIVHQYGEQAAAAMGIGNRMESFSYLTCYGFSMAASTMVGQNLGAGKPDRAARCAWGSLGIAVALTLVTSAVFILLPRQLANIFSSDPTVIAIATDYLIILGLSQMAMAFEIVLEGAFAGAGDTIPPMLVAIPGAIIRIPLAYYLAFNLGWGINGVWWTLTITSLIKAVVLAIWFYRGKWKEKTV